MDAKMPLSQARSCANRMASIWKVKIELFIMVIVRGGGENRIDLSN